MESALKTLLKGLIQSWGTRSSTFDDYVKGKGKGLVGLLYGRPGLGKPLTAEAIAEIAELPLYQLSSGSLGHLANEINKSLTHILELSSHWRAALRIDEADVFLAQRDRHDLERNAVVSIFHRKGTLHVLVQLRKKDSVYEEEHPRRLEQRRAVPIEPPTSIEGLGEASGRNAGT